MSEQLKPLEERLRGLNKKDFLVLDAVMDISRSNYHRGGRAPVGFIREILREPMSSSELSRVLHKLEKRRLVVGLRTGKRLKLWQAISKATWEKYRKIKRRYR